MATVVEIPLLASAPQKFTVTLEGATYNMRLAWNFHAQCWVLDIADVDDNPLIRGMAMVTGTDMMRQFPYVGPPGQMYMVCDQPVVEASFDGLGATSHLYYVSSTE